MSVPNDRQQWRPTTLRVSPLRILTGFSLLLFVLSIATTSVAYAAKQSSDDNAREKSSRSRETSSPNKDESLADNVPQSSKDSTAVMGVGASTVTQFKVTGTDGEGLRVRSAPSLVAPIVGKLPEDTVISLAEGVAVEADNERWLPVVANQTKGWTAARYLTRVVSLKPKVRDLPKDARLADRVTAVAEGYIGQPYVWGGSEPGGFDCSGFVQWVYRKNGVSLPRTVSEQIDVGKKVDPERLQPGDLLFFENTYTSGLSHIGIYVGSNQFIHAADEARGVTISSLDDDYWQPRFVQASRLKS